MKVRTFAMSMILGLGITALSASTYAQEATLNASIPFSFIAGNKTLPAGDYIIKRASSGEGVMLIRNVDNHHSAFVMAETSSMNRIPKESDLVFKKIDGQYFLSTINDTANDEQAVIPEPRAERQLERSLANKGTSSEELSSLVMIQLK